MLLTFFIKCSIYFQSGVSFVITGSRIIVSAKISLLPILEYVHSQHAFLITVHIKQPLYSFSLSFHKIMMEEPAPPRPKNLFF